MKRALRRTHLIAWLVLGPTALGVLIAALLARADAASHRSRSTPSAPEVQP